MDKIVSIVDSRHPSFLSGEGNWSKWRTTYNGGEDFRDTYLERFSEREEMSDFVTRKVFFLALAPLVPALRLAGVPGVPALVVAGGGRACVSPGCPGPDGGDAHLGLDPDSRVGPDLVADGARWAGDGFEAAIAFRRMPGTGAGWLELPALASGRVVGAALAG